MVIQTFLLSSCCPPHQIARRYGIAGPPRHGFRRGCWVGALKKTPEGGVWACPVASVLFDEEP